MPVCIVLGYAAGTAVGDAYTGRSTWELMSLSPQRFWSFGLSSLGISFAFLFYFYQREKSLELKRQASEARLKLLESQLEPHMLFNTLANLRVLIGTDPARATAMLDRLNDFLRATLTASRTEATAGRHTLTDEFARLRDYLELMAVRMGPRLQYALELPEALASHPVPPLLLQPLVENCIRHGLEPSLQGGEVRVSARRQGQQLVLEVSDTGVGSAPSPTPGFGLAQVRERLATAYPGQAHMDWHGQPGGGTRAVLTLPLHTPAP
ncbi:MAG: histidine kinase [Hydrogenophaga sp.]|nr:histidine kinase [Hydrogenophaga sp.]MBW0185112.1 histidine kinase [Hydrogenophaga sp.]